MSKNRCFFAINCFHKVMVEPEMIDEHSTKDSKLYMAENLTGSKNKKFFDYYSFTLLLLLRLEFFFSQSNVIEKWCL